MWVYLTGGRQGDISLDGVRGDHILGSVSVSGSGVVVKGCESGRVRGFAGWGESSYGR